MRRIKTRYALFKKRYIPDLRIRHLLHMGDPAADWTRPLTKQMQSACLKSHHVAPS